MGENQRRKRQRHRFIAKHGECKQCGSKENLTIDHILARSLGGSNRQDNWQVLCRKCNNKKSKIEGRLFHKIKHQGMSLANACIEYEKLMEYDCH